MAACLIVTFHVIGFFQLSPADRSYELLTSAVSFFFILSGFVLSLSMPHREAFKLGAFYRNRLVRIYPLYLFALMLFLLFPPETSYRASQASEFSVDLILQLALVQSVIATKALTFNEPGWSLSVEFVFSILFPFLYFYFIRQKSRTILFGNFAFWAVSNLTYCLMTKYGSQTVQMYTHYFPAFHLHSFVLGMSGAILLARHREVLMASKKSIRRFALISFLFFLGLLCVGVPLEKFHHAGLFNLIFISIILYFSLKNAPLEGLAANRFCLILGESSYALYLLQLPVVSMLSKSDLYLGWNGYLHVVVFLLVLQTLAIIAHFLIERPLIDRFKISHSKSR